MSIENFTRELKKVLRVYVAIICTELRNKECDDLFVLNDRIGLIRRAIYSSLAPSLEVLEQANPAYYNEIMKLIEKYIGQEERLVNICFNLFEKNCTDSNDNDNAVNARRVRDEIGIAISLTLEEQVINGSNFYSQLGLIDMKSGSVEDIVSTIFGVCQVNCVLDFSYATLGNLSAYLT